MFERRLTLPASEAKALPSPSSSSFLLRLKNIHLQLIRKNLRHYFTTTLHTIFMSPKQILHSKQPQYVISSWCIARYLRWRPREFRSGCKALLWKPITESVRQVRQFLCFRYINKYIWNILGDIY